MPKAPESVPAKTRTNITASSNPLAVNFIHFFSLFCPILVLLILLSVCVRIHALFIYFILYIQSKQSFYWTICKFFQKIFQQKSETSSNTSLETLFILR
ncbi:MAG TPA: hypothetical protein DEF02_02815 [Clostridiales bacterium]|nr:hypothetical protein [Clostridiales bacterium]